MHQTSTEDRVISLERRMEALERLCVRLIKEVAKARDAADVSGQIAVAQAESRAIREAFGRLDG